MNIEGTEMQINRNTYEEYFLLYVDDELEADERKAVEEFARQNPELAEELRLLGSARLSPDDSIVFPGKESLFRVAEDHVPAGAAHRSAGEDVPAGTPHVPARDDVPAGTPHVPAGESGNHDRRRRAVPFRWWKYAAAAMLLLTAGTAIWLLVSGPDKNGPRLAGGRGTPAGDTGTRTENAIAPGEEQEGSTAAEPNVDSLNPEIERVKSYIHGRYNLPSDHSDIKEEKTPRANRSSGHDGNSSERKTGGENNTRAGAKPPIPTGNEQESKKKPAVPSRAPEPSGVITPPPVRNEALPEVDMAIDTPPADALALNEHISDPQDEEAAIPEVHYAADYSATSDNVYFANTAISKRSKLRVVVRKASRLLDKLTSLN